MRREKRLFDRVSDFANLHRAFRGASRGKRDRPEIQAFEFHLESRFWQIRREVEAARYRWDAPRRFLIYDPKRREICAAPFRDRVLHHALFNVLDPILQRGFIADTFACIRGRPCGPLWRAGTGWPSTWMPSACRWRSSPRATCAISASGCWCSNSRGECMGYCFDNPPQRSLRGSRSPEQSEGDRGNLTVFGVCGCRTER